MYLYFVSYSCALKQYTHNSYFFWPFENQISEKEIELLRQYVVENIKKTTGHKIKKTDFTFNCVSIVNDDYTPDTNS